MPSPPPDPSRPPGARPSQEDDVPAPRDVYSYATRPVFLAPDQAPRPSPYRAGLEPSIGPYAPPKPRVKPPASRRDTQRALYNLQFGSEAGYGPESAGDKADLPGKAFHRQSLWLQRTLQGAPGTVLWAANPANAAIAARHVDHVATLERVRDLLFHGDLANAQLELESLVSDYVWKRTLEPGWNGFAQGIGAPRLHLRDHQLSDSMWTSGQNAQHFVRGVGAGVEDGLINDVGVGGLEALEDIERRAYVDNNVNLFRRLAGQAPVDLSAYDVNHLALEQASRRLHAVGQWIAPDDDGWTRAGRATGKVGGMLVLSAAQPELAPVLFGLQGVSDAAKSEKRAGTYGTARGDIGILFNGVTQALLGRIGFSGAPARAVEGIVNPFLRQAAGVGLEALNQGAISGASRLADNVANSIAGSKQEPMEGVGDAARFGAVFGAVMHAGLKAPETIGDVRSAWQAANRALEEARVFRSVTRAAAASKIRETSPERFAALMEAQQPGAKVYLDVRPGDAEGPLRGTEIVDEAAVNGAEAAANPPPAPDPPATPLKAEEPASAPTEASPEAAEAKAPPDQGVKTQAALLRLEILQSEYLAKATPSGAHEILQGHIRTSPDGMTPLEAAKVIAAVEVLPKEVREAVRASGTAAADTSNHIPAAHEADAARSGSRVTEGNVLPMPDAPLPDGASLNLKEGADRKAVLREKRTYAEVVAAGKVPRIGGRRPINYRYAGSVHPSGVAFTRLGFPNFEPHAVVVVKIKSLIGNRRTDQRLANADRGYPITPKGYVWHHVEDGVTMQLIPKHIHDSVMHTGGASVIRNKGYDK